MPGDSEKFKSYKSKSDLIDPFLHDKCKELCSLFMILVNSNFNIMGCLFSEEESNYGDLK